MSVTHTPSNQNPRPGFPVELMNRHGYLRRPMPFRRLLPLGPTGSLPANSNPDQGRNHKLEILLLGTWDD